MRLHYLAASLPGLGSLLGLLFIMNSANGQSQSTFAVGSDAPEIQFETADNRKILLSTMLAKKRIVLIFTPDDATEQVTSYLRHFTSKQMAERDLQVIVIADEKSGLQNLFFGEGVAVVAKSDVMPTTFSPNLDHSLIFVLIGKDKTIKLREQKLVQDKSLYAVIDAMPQRRAEMKNQKATN